MSSVGAMLLFMLPFAAAAVFTGVLAVRALRGRRRLAAVQGLRDTHADAPWLWRPDWAAGRVEDGTRTTARFAWVFAIIWNLVSLPSAYLGVREARPGGNPAALIVLLFPAIGVGLLVWAVRSTLRYRRYGISRFELTTNPGVIGHSLTGTVSIAEPLHPEGGFRVALVCLRRRTTGSGKSRSTWETTLWREDRHVPGGGTSVPVSFAVPPDALASDDSNPRDQLIWRLSVDANVPGVDYSSSFVVPVFRTAASDQPRSDDEEKATRDPAPAAMYRQPATSRIELTSNRRGTEILYPPARNPGAAAGLTVFFLIWCAAIWACVHFGAPVLFSIVFGLFGMLLLAGVLDAWLKVTRVTVEPGGVTVAKGYLITVARRTIPAGEIADVKPKIAMQAGSTPYYDVTIVRKDGKVVTAGSGVRDKREAEWLAATMKETLNVASAVRARRPA